MDEMDASAEDALPEMQGRVQRKLGRCMLLLQQYERLMKAIVSTHVISGPAHELHEVRLRATEKTQRKTMGQLLGELLGTFLVDASSEAAKDEDEEPNGRPNAEGAWVTFRCRISMESEQYAQTRLDLEQVVAMRNELVHHLSERFDLWTEEGCAGADAHLDECYGEIRKTYLRLRDIAKASDAGRAEMASFVNSQAGYDFIVDGVRPNGEGVDWARSTVVKLLRQAEEKFAQDGWTLLDIATDWIRTTRPDQTPEKYGCIRWRQVLHESRAFEVRREIATGKKGMHLWYRRRSDVAE